jgi:hypothetical protein
MCVDPDPGPQCVEDGQAQVLLHGEPGDNPLRLAVTRHERQPGSLRAGHRNRRLRLAADSNLAAGLLHLGPGEQVRQLAHSVAEQARHAEDLALMQGEVDTGEVAAAQVTAREHRRARLRLSLGGDELDVRLLDPLGLGLSLAEHEPG